VGQVTENGTRAAIRTIIRYRNGVLNGKGASLLDGYMEDLATDRIYRLMIAQRMRHGATPAESVSQMFDQELERILSELPTGTDEPVIEKYRNARRISESLIRNQEFDPV
jgi:malate synthase